MSKRPYKSYIKSDEEIELNKAIGKKIKEAVLQTRASTIASLNNMKARMQSMNEYQKLPEVRQAELDKPYSDLIGNIEQQHLIAVINDRLRYFEDQGYQKLLAKMADLAALRDNPAMSESSAEADSETSNIVQESKIEYVNVRQIKTAYDKAWLADKQDVEKYVETMRKALLEEISKGKRVQI